MEIFNGINEAKKLDEVIKNHIKINPNEGELAIILINENPISLKYVDIKKRVGLNLGINIKLYFFDTTQNSNQEIINMCENIFNSKNVTSTIVQLPLPNNELEKILSKIPIEKDIDMLSGASRAIYYKNDFHNLPPIVRSISHYFTFFNMSVEGSKNLVVGNGSLVGKPISYWLSQMGGSVQITENYQEASKSRFNNVILCAGVPNLASGEDFDPNTNIVDFGYSYLSNKIVGDFNISSKKEHLGRLSLSPGGMGPLVVRYLFLNHLKL